MAQAQLVVSVEEAQKLKRVVKRHSNWRVRERAQTLLLLAQGKQAKQVALEMELHPQTVGSTRRQKAWTACQTSRAAERPPSCRSPKSSNWWTGPAQSRCHGPRSKRAMRRPVAWWCMSTH